MTQNFTEIKVYEYIPESDSYGVAVVVNGVEEIRQVAASWFYEKWEALMQDFNAKRKSTQTNEDFCFGIIQEFHFRDDPVDLCYTFYRVNH